MILDAFFKGPDRLPRNDNRPPDAPKGVVFEPDDPDHNYQPPARPSPPPEAGFSLESR